MKAIITITLFFLPLMITAQTTYHVGPGQAYDSIGAVPWESLVAGDSVIIHWRAQPYREKWVMARQGTENHPIVVHGVSNGNNELPVIDAMDATTRTQLNFWNEGRGVIKIGGSNTPDQTPEYIVIEKTGHRSEIAELLTQLEPYGVLQFAKSGRIAITKQVKELNSYLKEMDEANRLKPETFDLLSEN